jgi:D-alanine-D-alanine ligase
MMNALPEDRYDVRDIFIDKKGVWHMRGMPADPARILAQTDVMLNALHGGRGEDGSVQRILERAGVPYAGARAHAAGLSLHKGRTRELLREAGIAVPHGMSFSVDDGRTTRDMAEAVFQRIGPPYLVKPASSGSSVGVRLAPSIVELPDMLGDVLDTHGEAVVEEYIRGHEAHTGVIEGFRNEKLYTLPPVHVIAPAGAKFIDAETYAQGTATYVVPSNFTSDEKQQIEHAARAAHRALGMSHFSESNMILTKRGPVLIEVNANPALHETAAFPQALEAVGVPLSEFLEHAIRLAHRGS